MFFQSVGFYLPVHLATQPKTTVIFTAMRTSNITQCAMACASPRQSGHSSQRDNNVYPRSASPLFIIICLVLLSTFFFIMQALWRGYRYRKTGTQEMNALRERAFSTTQNAVPGTTLQTRSTSALIILQKTCSGRLIWALMELGKLNLPAAKDSLLLCMFLSFPSHSVSLCLDSSTY
jgi:hypothetical protein